MPPRRDDDTKAAGQALLERVPSHWPVLERALGVDDGPWLCGEHFSWADVGGTPMAVRLPMWTAHLQPDPAEHPRTAAWFEALRARPTAAQVEAKGEPVEA